MTEQFTNLQRNIITLEDN